MEEGDFSAPPAGCVRRCYTCPHRGGLWEGGLLQAKHIRGSKATWRSRTRAAFCCSFILKSSSELQLPPLSPNDGGKNGGALSCCCSNGAFTRLQLFIQTSEIKTRRMLSGVLAVKTFLVPSELLQTAAPCGNVGLRTHLCRFLNGERMRRVQSESRHSARLGGYKSAARLEMAAGLTCRSNGTKVQFTRRRSDQ